MSTHSHRFDPVSGWCQTCNLRQDGRLVSKAGDVYRAGTFTHNDDNQIDQIIQSMKGQRA